jgi:uncharacterized protein
MYRLMLVLPAIAGLIAVTWFAGLRSGLLLLLGLGFGAALSAARFGFTTGWRDLMIHHNPWGMVGQMALLALCAVLAFPLLASFDGEIVGAIAPITWSLILGALIFGFAMQLADGCGSGTLYKAGASSPISWVVLPAFIAGSFLGASHQPLWEELGGPLVSAGLAQDAAPIDFIASTGLAGALAITLMACGLIGLLSVMYCKRKAVTNQGVLPKISNRWLWGALAIALLYALHLIVAGQPWGVVYGLGLWGAKIVTALGVDLSADLFWGYSPHAERIAEPLIWDTTSVTNIGLLYGALVASRWRPDEFKRKPWPGMGALMISIIAGLLMGYSSRMAYGCNVGAYLGGVASGSLHGWIWFALAFIGSIGGVKARQKAGIA